MAIEDVIHNDLDRTGLDSEDYDPIRTYNGMVSGLKLYALVGILAVAGNIGLKIFLLRDQPELRNENYSRK